MSAADAPVLAGIHHLKLPVTDLARSLEWYRSRLGYQVQIEFVEQGTLMGCGLAHPAGGPELGLRLDPDRARAAAGFDYFAIGVADKAAIDRLARRLDELGQAHAGVHRASMGWILPEVLDPDGHTLRFYTMEHHTDLAPVHAGVGLADLVQPAGEQVHSGLAGHADGEVVEPGGRAGPVRVEPQAEARAAGRMRQPVAHQRALLDELELDLVAQAAAVPLQRPCQIGDGQLEMVYSGQDRHVGC